MDKLLGHKGAAQLLIGLALLLALLILSLLA